MNYLDLNLNLSEEDAALKTETNKFAREVMRPISIQLDKMTPEEAITPNSPFWTLMRKGYELGYHKIAFQEQFGGHGLTPLQQALIHEELSWGSFGLALAINAGTHALLPLIFQNQELINRFTIPYCRCTDASIIGCWAITEPDHGSDTLMVHYPSFRDPNIKAQCVARLDGDEWVIEGQKAAWVSRGTIANCIALFCQIEPSMGHAGSGIFILSANLPGISKGNPLDKIGTRDLNQGEIFFDEVRIPKDSLLVGPENYENGLEAVLAGTTTLMAMWCTGLARAAFDEALAYARKRIQGGKPIIEHPTVKIKLFDMFCKVESSRQLSRATFVYNRTAKKPALEYGIAAKTFASQAALEVTSDAIQILGGIGISKDYLVEKLFRDARTTLICDGSDDILTLVGGNLVARTYPRKS
jgi:alkylation response protein AidB-like acyl-CoA dehydrogenase